MEFNHRDQYHLRGFGADLESASLASEINRYRQAWERSNKVGELPLPILLTLAIRYPKVDEPEEAEADEPEVDEQPEYEAPKPTPPKSRGRPKRTTKAKAAE